MPRDGGFLREVAARDKTGSQQAGDLYLPVLGAGRHLREHVRVTHTHEAKVWQQRARTTLEHAREDRRPQIHVLNKPQDSHSNVRES